VKKALNIIRNTLVWLVVALAIFMMIFTIVSVTTFNRNDRDLFGFRFYVVRSDSMAATDFNAGDLILVKETDPNTLEAGDIITFISQDSDSFGEIITHKIRERTVDANGNVGFVTYGTTTGVDDDTVVTYMYILGKYEAKIPYMGTFFNFLKTPQGYIVCIFVPFMLLILHQGINTVKLFRRYKGEQMEEMNAEKAKIEAERAENARMMEELLALKAQLEGKTKESPPEGEDANANG
jgi:signal peptidase I